MKRGPRFVHRWYAETMGYFWLPCPVCGRMFGGHEWGGTIRISDTKGRAVCSPECEAKGKAMTR